MDNTILDTLYGPIQHGSDDEMMWELYQTETLARLRDISLSSVPSRMSPTGQAASRFEHSVGVSHLARRLCQRRPVFRAYRDEIMTACLLHDSGSVPFSHTTEIFQKDLTGKTHEQAVINVLQRKEISRILARYGVDTGRVLDLIEGRHSDLGGLVAGSIDLDNLDNSARLLRSLGAVKEPHYDPSELCYAFTMRGGQLGLDASYLQDLLGWAECRQALYGEILYGDNNLSAACMLYRSLETAYAAGKLDKKFFGFGEGEALTWLTSEAPLASRRLVKRALSWRFYRPLHEYIPSVDDPRVQRLTLDWRARKAFADSIAKDMKVKAEAVTIYAGRDKGTRKIPLPFHGEYSTACEHLFSNKIGKQRIKIFCDPDLLPSTPNNIQRMEDAVMSRLESVEPDEDKKKKPYF